MISALFTRSVTWFVVEAAPENALPAATAGHSQSYSFVRQPAPVKKRGHTTRQPGATATFRNRCTQPKPSRRGPQAALLAHQPKAPLAAGTWTEGMTRLQSTPAI